ncbi:hypothetical protein K443DRAFT_100999 [Laccaria amethystina LaAM-08-1]|uniref:Uncharacterized protein n=1 Tax=Laccaria amethystina LaAM-08-1 TaxID=1095629 RepID=A0A0C9X557_9AGAR|nr:hypothetical protein K443DRAFT_100999 [Laccaria amethystina LaAM-08-1]
MKNSFLFFIPLTALIVHATPTIQNDRRMESFQAGDSLNKRSADQKCVSCPFPFQPYCHECPETIFGACLNTQRQTCGFDNALPSDDISCGKGTWGCIYNCCKE